MSEFQQPPRARGLRIKRLALKELRETLRDRRTIITLIAMPLLVYPILSLIFRTFLFSALMGPATDDASMFSYVIESELSEQEVIEELREIYQFTEPYLQLQARQEDANRADGSETDEENSSQTVSFAEQDWAWNPIGMADAISVEDVIRDGQAHVGLRVKKANENGRSGDFEFEIITSEDVSGSQKAARLLRDRIELYNRLKLQVRLQRSGSRPDVPINIKENSVVSDESPRQSVSIAAIIPLMLVLMTITGAVYPAIDLTAGERERGTLETLVAAPIPRIGILVSKFIAVLTVAVLTATLNVAGILVTIWAFQLEDMLGGGGLTFTMIVNVFALLILFAAFFSAVLLAVTSYARSFKEAQAYLIPIILFSLAPGLIALTPGLTLNGPLAVVPMVNILILARDVLQDQAEFAPAIVAILSTVLYGFLAILLAAKIFGTDAILYGSHGSWKDLFTRPEVPQSRATLVTATSCLALLFPANFVLIGFLGRLKAADESTSLLTLYSLMGLFTILTFLLLPYLLAQYQRIRISTGFALRMPKVKFLLIAFLLGCSLWPLVMSIITGWHEVLEVFVGEAEAQARHDRLIEHGLGQAEDLREISPFFIGLLFAIIPAVCEEWFFRGFLLRALLKDRSAWLAVVISALIFGLFHVLGNSVVAMDRFLPTTLVGLILGWLCYRTGSIVPGIILHMLHNGFVVFMAYYQPTLSKYSWFPDEEAHIPVSWIVASVLIGGGCIAYLHFTADKTADFDPEIELGSIAENP